MGTEQTIVIYLGVIILGIIIGIGLMKLSDLWFEHKENKLEASQN